MSSSSFHADILENGNWYERSILDQLGNIGAEAGRAIQAKSINNPNKLEWAWHRMDELFCATLRDARWRGTGKLRETLRAREVTYSFLDDSNLYSETSESLERYWMEWGILANQERREKRMK
jgi:hypothetical protein